MSRGTFNEGFVSLHVVIFLFFQGGIFSFYNNALKEGGIISFTEQKDIMLQNCLARITENKVGLEVGGPSPLGMPIYTSATTVDNVVFSENTVWCNQQSKKTYIFCKRQNGRVFILDAVSLSDLASNNYDFLFASHTLEHIANPLKAVREWLRVTKPGGHLILILPEKSHCFDHKRAYSKFPTLLDQYIKNVGEDDLSTLPEILEHHDLARDPPAGNIHEFKTRSLNNFKNRCLHHYVYDDSLLEEISRFFRCETVYKETQGLDRWFVMKKE
jgi:SAM-dependent methyltransferase